MLEKTLESPLDRNEIKPVNPKGNQPWIFIGKTNAEAEASILWPPAAKSRLIGKRPWCWERLRAGREEDDSRWAGWMASLMQRTSWVWANSGRLWRTGKPGVMQSMGSQRVWHNWETEQCMFQHYSLKPFHPLPPRLKPKACFHVCLLCCPANRIIRTIFL